MRGQQAAPPSASLPIALPPHLRSFGKSIEGDECSSRSASEPDLGCANSSNPVVAAVLSPLSAARGGVAGSRSPFSSPDKPARAKSEDGLGGDSAGAAADATAGAGGGGGGGGEGVPTYEPHRRQQAKPLPSSTAAAATPSDDAGTAVAARQHDEAVATPSRGAAGPVTPTEASMAALALAATASTTGGAAAAAAAGGSSPNRGTEASPQRGSSGNDCGALSVYCSSPEDSEFGDDEETGGLEGGGSSQGGFWYGEGAGASALKAAMGQWGGDLESAVAAAAAAAAAAGEGDDAGSDASTVAALLQEASTHEMPAPAAGGMTAVAGEGEDESWEIVNAPPRHWEAAVGQESNSPMCLSALCWCAGRCPYPM